LTFELLSQLFQDLFSFLRLTIFQYSQEDAIKADITGEKLEVSINSQLSSMSFSNYAGKNH